jgi:hypothetical protein
MSLSDQIRLEAAQMDAHLWRNNVGACTTNDGRFIRFGLANESKQTNAVLKSADLIGITPVTITPDMVGRTIGVFTSVEEKLYAHELTARTGRIVAQRKWRDLILQKGGIAIITNNVDMFKEAVYNFVNSK